MEYSAQPQNRTTAQLYNFNTKKPLNFIFLPVSIEPSHFVIV